MYTSFKDFSLIICNLKGAEGAKHSYLSVSQPAWKILVPISIILRSKPVNAQLLGAGQDFFLVFFFELQFFCVLMGEFMLDKTNYPFSHLAIIYAITFE